MSPLTQPQRQLLRDILTQHVEDCDRSPATAKEVNRLWQALEGHASGKHKAVVLTRDQIKQILENEMDWEPIDTRSFWRLAQLEDRQPGILAARQREYVKRILATYSQKGKAQ